MFSFASQKKNEFLLTAQEEHEALFAEKQARISAERELAELKKLLKERQ